MYVDVVRTTEVSMTQTASVLYLKLNHTDAEVKSLWREAVINGDADWGGATASHTALRQRFCVAYGGDGFANPTYLWTGLRFIKTTDVTPVYATRLKQDQHLRLSDWYRGSGHTGTFGSSNQLDLTLTDIQYFTCRLHSLTGETDVEELLASHLQARMKFDDTVGRGVVSDSVTSYDVLWDRIYDQSQRFQDALGRHYVTPLALGEEQTRFRLAKIAAKAVAVDLIRTYQPFREIVNKMAWQDWDDEVRDFLKSPPPLAGCELIGSEDGTGSTGFILERA